MALHGLKVGPLDPDRTERFGHVGGKAGAGSAKQLVRLHARQMPPQLRAALLKAHHAPRSKGLDRDEVVKFASSYRFPDGSPAIPKDSDVVGWNVHGKDDEEQIVGIVYRMRKSGRTGKSFVPYDRKALSKSADAGDERTRLAEAREAGSFALPNNLAKLLEVALSGRGESAGPSGDVEEDQRLAELVDTVDELRSRLDDAENPEPFPGYAEADVKTVEDAIGDAPAGFERELLKRRIRDAEQQRDKPRTGVLKATEPVELAPVGE